jgi:hypothetical protein
MNAFPNSTHGDINGDGFVDLLDAILLGISFGSMAGDRKWNPRADLNNDGIIDIADATILADSFGSKQARPPVMETEVMSLRIGENGWDSQGRFFACVYPNQFFSSNNGDPHNLTWVCNFSNNIRLLGFFIDRHDHIFICNLDGVCWRSTDHGLTFHIVSTNLGCFNGGFAEDETGLYCGRRALNGSQGKVYKSTDDGLTWNCIDDPSWKNQNHCHSLALDPATGWLYATLGDNDSYDAVWRSKLKDGSDWVKKAGDRAVDHPLNESSYQYVGIAFKDGYVYLSPDSYKAGIFRFKDDGSNVYVKPQKVLSMMEFGYWLQKDSNGRLWATCVPTRFSTIPYGGTLYTSEDGLTWTERYTTLVENYTEWLKTRTFIAGTINPRNSTVILPCENVSLFITFGDEASNVKNSQT